MGPISQNQMYPPLQRVLAFIKSPGFLASFICLVAYILLSRPAQLNYFKQFAGSLLDGRLNIVTSGETLDLITFNGKYYIYWPPAPSLIFLPLVAIFGQHLPDELVSIFIGAVNVWLVVAICKRLSNRFLLKISNWELLCIGIFFGLGTVHFYMAKVGNVWQISQIIAQFYLLFAIFFFLNNKGWLLSGIFLALAIYSRNNFVFSFPFFALLFIAMNPGVHFKTILKPATVFILPFVVFSLCNGWYNYARFHNFFDNGLHYHLMHKHFLDNFNQYGYVSWHYLRYNFYTEVLHFPTLQAAPLFIKEEWEGFGFIWASPLFLLIIPSLFFWMWSMFRKPLMNENNLITSGSLVAACGIAFVIFSIMGTGWVQFAARYTLDFYIFLIIFILFSWPQIKVLPLAKTISLVLLVLSIAVQTVGAVQSQ